MSQTKNTARRFGIGDYEGVLDEGERISIQDLRSSFLDTVSRLAPEVCVDLENELLEETYTAS